MKTTKLFFMAALALMTAACSNDDNDLTTPQPQKAEGITITAQLAPKTNSTTRAISDQSTYIKAEWAVDEHIAILYQVSSTKYEADARITAVDGTTGVATISFTVQAGTPDNTACTLVYPLSAAKDDYSGVKSAGVLLAAQDGTLNANLDVRVGAGTIQTSTPGLTVTTQPEAQFAIFKFTVKNSDASATIDVKPLIVSIGTLDYIITPTSATSEIYAALPPISGEAVRFTATSSGNTYINAKSGVTFSAGNFYKSDVKLNPTTLKYLIIKKGSTDLSGDKLFYYNTGETYEYAAGNHDENKYDGGLRWGTWTGSTPYSIYFKEVSGDARDMSISGSRPDVKSAVNASGNYYFVMSY